ncbi:MAG: hypothetical protein JXX29_10330 [Deltaproteobacteria bacterium]|nr:hypothetical protein [Deltaproteobacteria bacterium]MBN2672063.1 hypothetical protein [Deltaproteobacteria bacterium]
MMDSVRRRWWVITLLSLVWSGVSGIAMAEETLPKATLLVFQSQHHLTTDTELIVTSVKDRLKGASLALSVQRVSSGAETPTQRKEIASDVLLQGPARLVFYWDLEAPEQIFFYVKNGASVRMFSRKLEGAGELSRADVVGIISLTTIELLLDTGELVPAPAPETPAQPDSPPEPPPEVKPPLSARWYVDAAYRLTLGSFTPHFAHGARMKVAYRFLKALRVEVGAGLDGGISSEESGVRMEIVRLPVQLGILALGDGKRVRLGGGVRAAFVFSRMEPHSERTDVTLDSPYWRRNVQIQAFGKTEVVISSIAAAFVEAGVCIWPRKVETAVDNGPHLLDEYWRIQPFVSVGLQLFF